MTMIFYVTQNYFERKIIRIMLLICLMTSRGFAAPAENPEYAHVDFLVKLADDQYQHDAVKALSYAADAMRLSDSLHYTKGQVYSRNVFAEVLADSGKFDEAMQFYRTAYRISDSIHHAERKTFCLIGIGDVYIKQGDYPNALKTYFEALHDADSMQHQTYLSRIYNNIGVIYIDLKNDSLSLEYHTKALEVRKKIGNREDIAGSLGNIGNVYYDQMKDTEALEYYMQSLKIREDIGDRSGQATLFNNIAGVYSDWGQDDKAIKYMMKTIAIRREIGERMMLASSYTNLGDLYTNHKDYANAFIALDSAISIAKETGNKRMIRNMYESMSNTYQVTHNYEKALENYKLFAAYKDSVMSEKNTRTVSELQTKYDVSQKENKIKLQSTEIGSQKKQKLLLLGLLLTLIVLAVLLFNRSRIQHARNLAAETLRQEKIRMRSMIQTLEEERTRISGELHDGLGQVISAARLNIESVRTGGSDSHSPKIDQALHLIDHSFHELRTISHSLMPAVLSRQGLVPAVKEMALSINTSGKLKLSVGSSSELTGLSRESEVHLFRIIQELVSNTIRHSGATEASIQFIPEGTELTVMYEDNGKGLVSGAREKSKGNGWHNIQTRLDLLHGEMEVDSGPGRGVVISVRLSLMNADLTPFA